MDFSNLNRFCDRIVNPNPNIKYSINEELTFLKKDGENVMEDVLEELKKYPTEIDSFFIRDNFLNEIRKNVLTSRYKIVKKNKNFKKWLKKKKIKINYIVNNDLYDNILAKYILSFYKNKLNDSILSDEILNKSIHYEVYGFFCSYFQKILLEKLDEHHSMNIGLGIAIKGYLDSSIESNKENVFVKKDEIIEKFIFKPEEGFKTFNFLLDKFGINIDSCLKRGVQAKLNAIWGCPISKNKIFREHTELKDYIKFLNQSYNLKYNSRTMSDGYNYHQTIRNWMIEYNNVK